VTTRPYLLLDAGGTLLFGEPDVLGALAREEGHVVAPTSFYEAHFRLVYHYDVALRDNGAAASWSLQRFIEELFRFSDLPKKTAERCADAAMRRHEQRSLWTYTEPWVAETLERLHGQGVRMAVISNADGRVAQQLAVCGLDGFFEAVFDSARVGIEKPDPRLFDHALRALGVAAADCVYVGYVFQVDVVGANRAKIGAVHLDPFGCYADWPGVHLRDVRDLPEWLERFGADPGAYDLFPTHTTTGKTNEDTTDEIT